MDIQEPETDADDDPDEADDERDDKKREMAMVAWTGRKQFAALLKAVGIVNPTEIIEQMKAQGRTPTATPAPVPENVPVPEESTEPTPEPEKTPEPENAVVDAKPFYDRLKTIKSNF